MAKKDLEVVKDEVFVSGMDFDIAIDVTQESYHDRISVGVSPFLCETIIKHFKEASLDERQCYITQGIYREIADAFDKAHGSWKEQRDKIWEDEKKKKVNGK